MSVIGFEVGWIVSPETKLEILLVEAGFQPGVGGVVERVGILPGDLDRFAADQVGVAAVGEIGGVLEPVVEPRAALDPVVAGKLVPGEQIGVVEHEALGVLVRAGFWA